MPIISGLAQFENNTTNSLVTLDGNFTTIQNAVNGLQTGANGSASISYTPPGIGAIATSVAAALNANKGRSVRLIQDAAGVWLAYNYDGSTINISSSTTSGVQECINACQTNNCDLYVVGKGFDQSSGANDGYLPCSTQVLFPPMRGKVIYFGAVQMKFLNGIGAVSGMKFGSFENVKFVFDGNIFYSGTTYAVEFTPTNNVQPDAAPAAIASEIYFNTIGIGGDNISFTACVRFDGTNLTPNTLGNRFTFLQLVCGGPALGNGAQYGIEINNVSGSNSFIGNEVNAYNILQPIAAGIHINAANCYANIFRGLIQLGYNNSIGVDTNNGSNRFHVDGQTILSATGTVGHHMRTGSSGNVTFGGFTGAGTAYIDDTGGKNIAIVNGFVYMALSQSTTTASSAITTTDTYFTPTFKIPANTTLLGKRWRMIIQGTCTSSHADTVIFKARCGTAGTTADAILHNLTLTSAGAGTNIPFEIRAEICADLITASGSMSADQVMFNSNNSQGIATTFCAVGNTGTTGNTVNFTVDNFLGMSVVSNAITTSVTIQRASVQNIL